MGEDHRKWLEMLQTVINRMAQNSFQIKGWAVTVVAALFALGVKESQVRFAVVPFIPVAMFWVLDGFFLDQERRYRKLFSKAVANSVPLYSMRTQGLPFSWLGGIISTTLVLFYGGLASTIVLAMWLLGDF